MNLVLSRASSSDTSAGSAWGAGGGLPSASACASMAPTLSRMRSQHRTASAHTSAEEELPNRALAVRSNSSIHASGGAAGARAWAGPRLGVASLREEKMKSRR